MTSEKKDACMSQQPETLAGQLPKNGMDSGKSTDALRSDPQAEIAKLKHAISGLIPWVASSGRGAAQEALAEACELIGADPFMWSAHPDVLAQRRPDLERRNARA